MHSHTPEDVRTSPSHKTSSRSMLIVLKFELFLTIAIARAVRQQNLQMTMQSDTASMIMTNKNDEIERKHSPTRRQQYARERLQFDAFSNPGDEKPKRQNAHRAVQSQALITFGVHGQEVANVPRSVLERLLRAPAQFSVCSPSLGHRGSDVTFPSAGGSQRDRIA